jgi:hypothetical protein
VARFYFDVQSDLGLTKDETGTEYPDAQTALSEARNGALQAAADHLRLNQPIQQHTLIVRDESGATVGAIKLQDIGQEAAQGGSTKT